MFSCENIPVAYSTEHTPQLRLSATNQKEIFCVIRRKWLLFTPEEWVRQHFLLYLIHQKKYTPAQIAVEKKLIFHTLTKRFDIVVFSQAKPYLLIECKASTVALSSAVWEQISTYQHYITAANIVITNGVETQAVSIVNKKIVCLPTIPTNPILL